MSCPAGIVTVPEAAAPFRLRLKSEFSVAAESALFEGSWRTRYFTLMGTDDALAVWMESCSRCEQAELGAGVAHEALCSGRVIVLAPTSEIPTGSQGW